MGALQSPYDFPEYLSVLNDTVFELIIYCQKDRKPIEINFENEYIEVFWHIQIPDNITNIQCVYYNKEENSWMNGTNGCKNQIIKNFKYLEKNDSCLINKTPIMIAITGYDEQLQQCPENCEICNNTICLSCKINFFNINNECLSRAALKLEDFLSDSSYIYILPYGTNESLGVNQTGDLQFYDYFSDEIANWQIQWKVKITESTYEFTSNYNSEVKLNFSSESSFSLIEPDLEFKNVVQLQLEPDQKCLDNTFAIVSCTSDIKQYWEFFPLQNQENQVISLKTEFLTDSHQIKIEYSQYKENVIYVIAEKYNLYYNEIDEYACSSRNDKSLIEFKIEDNKVIILTSLRFQNCILNTFYFSDLNACGFSLNTDNSNLHTLTGQIIHIYEDSFRIFQSPLKISFNPNIEIEANIEYNSTSDEVKPIIDQGDAIEYDISFYAEISTEDSLSQINFKVNGSFTIDLALSSVIKSIYTITVPTTGKLINTDSEEKDVPLAFLSQEPGKNEYKIAVNLEEISSGTYNLKFSVIKCVVNLQKSRLLEELSADTLPETAKIYVNKEIDLQSNYTNKGTQSNENLENLEGNQDSTVISLQVLIFIILGGISFIAIIIGIVILMKRKLKSKRETKKNTIEQPEQLEQEVRNINEIQVNI